MNTTTIEKTTIRHTCGHTGSYNIKKRSAYNWLKTQPCRACKQVVELRTAAAYERRCNLPPLIGVTDKQIDYASVIRARILHDLGTFESKIPNPVPRSQQAKVQRFKIICAQARRCTSAAAWIKRADLKINKETINAMLTKGE